MQTVVIYDSKFGNTEKIAEAIGRGAGTLGGVMVASTAEAAGDVQALTGRPDLLLLGGPTQNRRPSPGLRAFTDALPVALRGLPSASFDTRYRGPAWLMGSAAAEAAKAIRGAGGTLVAPSASFFIARRGPVERQTREPGEIERAEGWGRGVVATAIGRTAEAPTRSGQTGRG